MAVADEDIEKALQVMGAKDVENVRDFLKNLDNLEVEEKNGHKMLRAQSGDTEYFCIQAQDKLILAIRDEDAFSYFAQTKDGKLMQVSGEDFSLNDNGKTLSVKIDGEEERIEIDVQKRSNGTIKSSTLNVTGKEPEIDEYSGAEVIPSLSVKTTYDRDGNAVSMKVDDRIFTEDLGSRYINIDFGKDSTIKEISQKGMNSDGDLVDITIKDGKITDGIVVNDNGVWRYTNGQKEFLGANVGLVDDIEKEYRVTQQDYKDALNKEFDGGYILSEVVDENGHATYYRSDDSRSEPYEISKYEYETGLTNDFIATLQKANISRDEYRKMQQSDVMEVAGYKVAYIPASNMDPKEVQAVIDEEKGLLQDRDSAELKNDLRAQAEKGGELSENPKARSQEIRFSQHYAARDSQKTVTERTDNPIEEKKDTNVVAMGNRASEGR